MKQQSISEESFRSLLDDQGDGELSSISGSGTEDDCDSELGDESSRDGRHGLHRMPEEGPTNDDDEEGAVRAPGQTPQFQQQVPQFVFQTPGKICSKIG